MSARRALITGISGQDGSYLAELLLEKGYEVTGLVRTQERSLGLAEHLRDRLTIVHGDLLMPKTLTDAIASLQPHELYHLAAPSFVPDSWRDPASTVTAIAGATAAVLCAVREQSASTRVFLASSGAMFGDAPECPQHENTLCKPQSPYATAKLAAHLLVGQMRAHDGIFACSGILYNHESERRPEAFVTRKITKAAAAIKLGLQDQVVLGDLAAVRDWSFAGDVMAGAWAALQQQTPDDYIFASGKPHTVADLASVAFGHVGLDAMDHISVDEGLRRRQEGTPQVGDPNHARKALGWQPTVDFEQLIKRMVDHDLQALA